MSVKISDPLIVTGTALFTGTTTLPDGTITNAKIIAAAGVAASKLEHQHAVTYYQADGTDVAAATVPIYTCRGATGEVIDVQVVCFDAPSGGDKAFTVDVKKCNTGTPTGTSVLSSAVSYSSTQSDCEVEAGTIVTSGVEDLAVGDTLIAVVAVSGSTGNQGQGLCVTVTVLEDAS